MTYQDTANLAADSSYQQRLGAAAFTEALGKSDGLSDFILRNPPMVAVNVFGAPVASSPGFGDKFAAGGQASITDGDLLSAIQANWARLAGLYAPAA